MKKLVFVGKGRSGLADKGKHEKKVLYCVRSDVFAKCYGRRVYQIQTSSYSTLSLSVQASQILL